VTKVARALKPGGVLAVIDLERPATPGGTGQFGAILDLYFALVTGAGTWSFDEIAGWQRDAGLKPEKPVRLRTLPGGGLQAARKA
jgi:SAM-dependent methyltransferase